MTGLQPGAPWPTWRYCPTNQGRGPFVGSKTGTIAWTFQAGDMIRSSPVIGADGTVYFGSSDSNLYAVTGEGKLLWTYLTGGPITQSPAIGSDGTIYVKSTDAKIYALNPDGSEKWSPYLAGCDIYSSPTLRQDGALLVGGCGSLLVLNTAGTKLWEAPLLGGSSTPAVLADSEVVVAAGKYEPGAGVHRFSSTGDALWTFTGMALPAVQSSPAIGSDGTIFIGSDDHNLYALDAEGNEVCKFPVGPARVHGSPAIGADGTIYITTVDNDSVFAVNQDCTQKWVYETGANEGSSVALDADGVIFVGSGSSRILALSPEDGQPLWAVDTQGAIYSSPAIGADGTIFVGSDDHNLYAVGP